MLLGVTFIAICISERFGSLVSHHFSSTSVPPDGEEKAANTGHSYVFISPIYILPQSSVSVTAFFSCQCAEEWGLHCPLPPFPLLLKEELCFGFCCKLINLERGFHCLLMDPLVFVLYIKSTQEINTVGLQSGSIS